MTQARAATEAEAASLALGHLGRPAIADLAEDNKRARAMRQFFAVARDTTQRAAWWNFCKAHDRPAADSQQSIGSLKYRFALRADCLRVRYLEDSDGRRYFEGCGAWSIENADVTLAGAGVNVSVLATNLTAPIVCFTRRIETVSLWAPDYLMGFSKYLAGLAASQLGHSVAKGASLRADALNDIANAASIDSKEESVQRERPIPSFCTARWGRGRYRNTGRLP